MAEEEEDDLAALRNAVLASMKAKSKQPVEVKVDDDVDIEDLRLAALRTKKQEPTNCHDSSLSPVALISSIGHDSPYQDHLPYGDQLQPGSLLGQNFHQPSSPHQQNFHQPGSPHHQNFHQGGGHLHRPNFHQGRRGGGMQGGPHGGGMLGGSRGRGFGPRMQFIPNTQIPPSSSSNLIVLTETPVPPHPPKGPPENTATQTKVDSDDTALMLLVRPQDKWAGGGGSTPEPAVKAKAKGPARFNRLEDSNSDSDESDDDYIMSSVKDALTSSSSSSEEEPIKDDDSDNEVKSPDEDADKMASTEITAEKEAEIPLQGQEVVGTPSAVSEPFQSCTKPDYTRVPPPALSPAPSPPRKPNQSHAVRKDGDGGASVNEGSTKERLVPQVPGNLKCSLPLERISSSCSTSSNKHGGLGDNSDAKPPKSSDIDTGRCEQQAVKSDDPVLEARRRKFATNVSVKQSGDVPKRISLEKRDPKQHHVSKLAVQTKPVQSKQVSPVVAKPTEPNGQTRVTSASSQSPSSSGLSDTSSSSSSLSDSDSDSESTRRDKYKNIERGKEDIERERRQRVAREREERREERRTREARPPTDRDRDRDRVRRLGMDHGRLPRAYSENMNREQSSSGSHHDRDLRERQYIKSRDWKSHQDERRHPHGGNLQEAARRTQTRREVPEREACRHGQSSRDSQKPERPKRAKGEHVIGEHKYRRPVDREDINKRNTREEAKHEHLRTDDMRYRLKQDNAKGDAYSMASHGAAKRDRSPIEDSLKREQMRQRSPQERGHERSRHALSKGRQAPAPEARSDLRQTLNKKTSSRRVESDGDLSDFSTGSELDESHAPKLRSVTQVVKAPAGDAGWAHTGHRGKSRRSHSRTRSSEKQKRSQDADELPAKVNEKSAHIDMESDYSSDRKRDARQIICKLKGADDGPSIDKSKASKLSPKINITFGDDPVLEEKPTMSRLSVHDRLGMPVKRDKLSKEFSVEPKITRRVIAEDLADARHRPKERRKGGDTKEIELDRSRRVIAEEAEEINRRQQSDKGGEMKVTGITARAMKKSRRVIAEESPADARDRLKERRKDGDIKEHSMNRQSKRSRRVITEEPLEEQNKSKEHQRNNNEDNKLIEAGQQHAEKVSDRREKHKRVNSSKKKNYSIWSTKREVSVDSGGDEVSEPPPSWINQRLGRLAHEEDDNDDDDAMGVRDRLDPGPELEVSDARSHLSSRRSKARSMEHRLGSVILMPDKDVHGDTTTEALRRKRGRAKDQTGTDKEAELNARIQRIREKNAGIERRRKEVERDKQRYASYRIPFRKAEQVCPTIG